jgi:hypothetical protein
MGRIVPPFRQLYQETISDLQTELKGALVDLGHKSAFDLLLKEAWNPEVAAMGNSTLPTVLDKLNVMSTIHLRKLIATLVRENGQRDAVIGNSEPKQCTHITHLHKPYSFIRHSFSITILLEDWMRDKGRNHLTESRMVL